MAKLNLLAVEKEVEEENAPDFVKVVPVFTREFRDSCEPLAKFLGWDLGLTMNHLSQIVDETHLADLGSMYYDGREHFFPLGSFLSKGPFYGEVHSVCISPDDIENWKEYYNYRKELARGRFVCPTRP